MSKTLILDIETAPTSAYVWGLWKQNVGLNQIIQTGYILNWSAKWLDSDYLYTDSLHYHDLWKTDPTNDEIIVQNIRDLLDEADFVVTHNGDKFDIPTIRGRMAVHGIKPFSPVISIDTLKIAKRQFRLPSNKLNYIAQALGLGSKIDTGGFELWSDIISKGCRKAFNKMVEYCENDVLLQEEVYKALRAYDDTHPSLHILDESAEIKCNACGSTHVLKKGRRASKTRTYQRYVCGDCGHNMRSRKSIPKSTDHLLRST